MKVDGSLEKFYEYAFSMQTVLVTCNDGREKTNIITITWHTTLSKKPPLYAISISPNRYSHGLIIKNKEFVINFVNFDMGEKVHFYGTHSGRSTNKLDVTKFTLIPAKNVKVPLINECFLILNADWFII